MTKQPVIFLVCTGVGHIRRGYESFTEECFAALKTQPGFKLILLKGGGKRERQVKVVPCLQRQKPLTKTIAKRLGADAYVVEQCSFLVGMLPLLIMYRPKLIYYSDFKLGTWLWHLRRILGFEYKLLFSNGAPNGPPFTRTDHVQQLLPYYYQQAISAGASAASMTLLPYGFAVPDILSDANKKMEKRLTLDLPINKKIIISVGAINRHHKRMDYVIREFAKMDLTQYYLVLLGQIETESIDIMAEAKQLLPPNSYCIKAVHSSLVTQYLQAADYFVLASLHEGFGRVLIEALTVGLLPIVHNTPIMHEVLQSYGVFLNMQESGSLQKGIQLSEQQNFTPQDLWQFAYNQYSWKVLTPQYNQLIHALLV